MVLKAIDHSWVVHFAGQWHIATSEQDLRILVGNKVEVNRQEWNGRKTSIKKLYCSYLIIQANQDTSTANS